MKNIVALYIVTCILTEALGKEVPLDTLKVTYGSPGDPGAFKLMPRLLKDAIEQGFQLVDSTNLLCDHGKFLGHRYWINKDPTIILIYDIKGTIAGLQSGVPKEKADTYKSTYNYATKPFYQNDSLGGVAVYIATMYFISPGKICSKGRTEKNLNKHGTAPKLYLQNGPKPIADSVKQKRTEDAMADTQWTKALCVPMMGQHYFYNVLDEVLSEDTYCFFLQFNRNELSGCGFIHAGVYDQPQQMEDADLEKKDLTWIPKNVERKLKECGGSSTVHVFFNTDPENLNC